MSYIDEYVRHRVLEIAAYQERQARHKVLEGYRAQEMTLVISKGLSTNVGFVVTEPVHPVVLAARRIWRRMFKYDPKPIQ